MKSIDLITKQKEDLLQDIKAAIKDDNEDNIAKAFTDFASIVQDNIVKEAKNIMEQVDTNVLNYRGVRQLTSKENKFYEGIKRATEQSNAQKAFTDLEISMPQTIIDAVFDDIKTSHPLLDEINFVNTMGKIRMIVNKTGIQLANWGKLTAGITKELEASIDEIDTGLFKLTAYIPISKDMITLGASWIDRYVRAILSEAIALSVEEAIINGSGKDCPIGMIRSVADNVTVTAGEYPKKSKEQISEFTPTSYGELISRLSISSNNKTRVVEQVILVVNPKDYLKRIMPATTIRKADGTYANDILPFPTKIIQSSAIGEGDAVLGLAKRYFMSVGSPIQGNIEYDDSVQFLEDNRVYATKLFGNGRPLDDNAFIYLDISKLEPKDLTIVLKDTIVKTTK